MQQLGKKIENLSDESEKQFLERFFWTSAFGEKVHKTEVLNVRGLLREKWFRVIW